MQDFLSSLTTFVSANASWAPLVVGVLAFLESLAIISLFVPATMTLVAPGKRLVARRVDPLAQAKSRQQELVALLLARQRIGDEGTVALTLRHGESGFRMLLDLAGPVPRQPLLR